MVVASERVKKYVDIHQTCYIELVADNRKIKHI